jgi:hypothetical protein
MDDETFRKLTFEPDQTIVFEGPASTDTAHRIDIAFHRYGRKALTIGSVIVVRH